MKYTKKNEVYKKKMKYTKKTNIIRYKLKQLLY